MQLRQQRGFDDMNENTVPRLETGRDPDSLVRDRDERPTWKETQFASELIAVVPGIIYIFNHETKSNEYSNHSVAELLGYSTEEVRDLGDQILLRVIDPSFHEPLFQHVDELRHLAPGQTKEWEYMARTKTGDVVWLNSIDTALEYDAQGLVLRHVGIATDITALKKAQLRLEDMNVQLEKRVAERTKSLAILNSELEQRVINRTEDLWQKNRELSELAYVATHDLKVPVSNMCVLAESLHDAKAEVPAVHHETLDWLAESGVQARARLDALVEVAVTREAKTEGIERICLKAFVDEALRVKEAEIRVARAKVTVDIPDMPLLLFGPKSLRRSLDALLRNALSYADETRALKIDIRVDRRDGKILLSVQDNGRGLEPHRDHAKVFGLFRRAHVDPPGQGMDLYCSEMVLRRLGGSIKFTGQKGKGAVFTLVLPDETGER